MKKFLMFFVALALASSAFAGQTLYSNDFNTNDHYADSSITVGHDIVGNYSSRVGVAGYSLYNQFDGYMLRNVIKGGSMFLSLSGDKLTGQVDVSFSLAIIDSWDGSSNVGGSADPDYLDIMINDNKVFTGSFDNFLGADNHLNVIGDGTVDTIIYRKQLGFNGNYNDSAYDVNFTIDNPLDTFKLVIRVYGGGYQGGIDESFAIDNLVVSTPAATVPAPGAILLASLGTLIARKRVR